MKNMLVKSFVCLASGLLGLSAFAKAEVSVVDVKTHYPWHGGADVIYRVKGLTAGSELHVSAQFTVGGKTVDADFGCVTADGVYTNSDWKAEDVEGFIGRDENAQVKLWLDEPNYAIVDLSKGASAGKGEYGVTYRHSLTSDEIQANDEYKTTKLVLRNLGGKKYAGVYEVTQKQYELVVGTKPAYFSQMTADDKYSAAEAAAIEAKRPVERVSYEILTAEGGFFKNLKTRSGLEVALPTKEEWQAAAGVDEDGVYNPKAGVKKNVGTVASLNDKLLMDENGAPLARYGLKGNEVGNQYCDDSKGTAMVGSYYANDNGLFDMHGNVSEWTQSTSVDTYGKTWGYLCGGNYQSDVLACSGTSTVSMAQSDGTQYYYTGFRVFGDCGDTYQHPAEVTKTFTADIAAANTRAIRVEDKGSVTNFYYKPANYAEEIEWVVFDDPATVNGTKWLPTKAGDNIAYSEKDPSVTATFVVDALDMQDVVSTDYEGVYDGEEHTGSVTVGTPATDVRGIKYGLKEGTYDLDEALEYMNVTNVTIYWQITSSFYKTSKGSFKVVITPLSIAAPTTIIKASSDTDSKLVFTGYEVTNKVKSVTVKNEKGVTLPQLEPSDYTVFNNWGLDAGKYTLTVQGKGNYTGEWTLDWDILPFNLDEIDEGASVDKGGVVINLASDLLTYQGLPYEDKKYVYTGDYILNEVKSVAIGKTEFQPVCFDVKVGSNTGKEVGEYEVEVSGKGNFQGTAKKKWYIQKRDISEPNAATVVTLTGALTYNGKKQTCEVKSVVTAQGALVAGADYTVTGNEGVDASAKVGKYTMTIDASVSKNFKGSVTKDWTIGQKALEDLMFTLEPTAVTYNRNQHTDDIAVAADDGTRESDNKQMIVSSDYKITYGANIDCKDGSTTEGEVILTGQANYTGTVTKYFDIKPAMITSLTLDKTECVWNKEGNAVNATSVKAGELELAPTTEYVVQGNVAKDTGKYTAKATSTSPNFTGEATAAWQIIPAAPKIYWADGNEEKGRVYDSGDMGIKFFYVADLTVAGHPCCNNETLTWTTNGVAANIPDNKFHVTGCTTIEVFSTSGELVGDKTKAVLVPGKCADLEITPTSYNKNDSVLTISARQDEKGNYIVDKKPLGIVQVYNPFGVEGKTYFKILTPDDEVVQDTTEYTHASSNLKVSADELKIVAWTEDEQYLGSNVLTQEVSRTIKSLDMPKVEVQTFEEDVSKRIITLSHDDNDAVIYYTTAISNGITGVCTTGFPAIDPRGTAADNDPTHFGTKWDGQPKEFELEKDEVLNIKAVAYKMWSGKENDFEYRSAVTNVSTVREWCIGDAMDCEDQKFYNGTNQVVVIPGQDGACTDVVFLVTNDTTAVGEECMRSGVLPRGNLKTSSLTTFVDGPGMVVFNWKAYCEDDPTGETWDHGEFVIDGVITNKIDGKTTWQTVTNMVNNAGRHMLTWTYVKDFSKNGEGIAKGQDCILVDAFSFVTAKEMKDLVVEMTGAYTYNGSKQNPTNTSDYVVKAVDPRTGIEVTLTEGEDYSATAEDKTDAETYEITFNALEGSLFAKGSFTTNWKIKPLSLANATVEFTDDYTYTGAEQKPEKKDIKVTVPGAAAGGTDLEVTGTSDWGVKYTESEHVDATNYTFTVTGSVNLADSTASNTWTIKPKALTDDMVSLTWTKKTYNGETQVPELKLNEDEPITTDDLTVTPPSPSINKGTYTIEVAGKGNYTGSITPLTYEITTRNISSSTIYPTYTEVVYKNSEYVNNFTVTNNLGQALVENEDYTVTGDAITRKDVRATPYTTTIKGIGNYSGETSFSWKIKPLNISTAEVTLEEAPVYDGTEKTQGIEKVMVGTIEVTSYTVTDNKATNAGEYQLTVTGSGNFTGSVQKQWKIEERGITEVTLVDSPLTWNGVAKIAIVGTTITRTIDTPPTEQTQKVVVKAGDLTLGEDDYDIVGNQQTDAGKYQLTVTGKGNYKGEIANVDWTIKPTVVTITPNKNNPGEFEEMFASGKARIMMAGDVADWKVMFTKHTFIDGVAQPESSENQFRTFQIKERTVITGWATVGEGADKVEGDKITVDYKMGMTAKPVVVLQNMENGTLPVYDDTGLATMNEVTGLQTPTNFFFNAQKVVLTRGNVNSLSNVIAGTEAELKYIDGALAYTLDGTEPVYTNGVLEGTTKLWETNKINEIFITNTTMVIAKVFGDQYFDSQSVTNVFVRERNEFTAPKVWFMNAGDAEYSEPTIQQHIDALPYTNKIERTDAYTNKFGKLYYQIDEEEAQEYTAPFELAASAVLKTWVEDDTFECTAVTNEIVYEAETQLATPTVAFNKDNAALVQYQNEAKGAFSNKCQVIDFLRKDTSFTCDTDGHLEYSCDDGATWIAADSVTIWGSSNIWVKAVGSTKGLEDSEVCKTNLTQIINEAKPVVTFAPTPTVKQVRVELTCAEQPSATIYYTTNGVAPDAFAAQNAIKYEGAFNYDIAVGETVEVQAIAYVEDGVGDYSWRSSIDSGTTNRVENIGDVIKSDDPTQQAKNDQPDTSDMTFTNSSDTWKDNDDNWYTNNWFKVVKDGREVMRSGVICDGNEGQPWRITTLVVTNRGPGKIQFNWKSSTEFLEGDPETMYDFGTFYVDGEPVAMIWGTNDTWTTVSTNVYDSGDEAQLHEFKWTYEKDWMDDEILMEELEIEDCIWVDDLVWTPVADMKQALGPNGSVEQDVLTYNGGMLRPTFNIKIDGKDLKEGVDYTMEVTEQTYGAEYDCTLHATGTNYTGSVDLKWTIQPASLEDAVVTLLATNLTYDVTNQFVSIEKAIIPGKGVDHTDLDITDLIKTDATITGTTNATNRGEYEFTIEAINKPTPVDPDDPQSLTNSVTIKWYIDPRPLTDNMIKLSGKLTYAGGAERTKKFSVQYSTETLASGVDYTLVAGTDKGTTAEGNTIKINAVEDGNYTGSAEQAWTMNPLDISEGSVNIDPLTLVYNGNEQYVTFTNVTVDLTNWSDNPISLTNENWEVSGTNGTAVGEYYLVVKPMGGNITGNAISNKWTITPADIKEVEVVLGPYNTYDGTTKWQEIVSVTHPTIGSLEKDVDYTVTSANKTDAGKYVMTLTGKGNWTGTKGVDYELLPALIDSIEFVPASYTYDGTMKTPEIIVKAGTLVATVGKDFTTNGVSSAVDAGTNKVVVTGSYVPPTTYGLTGNFKVPSDTLSTNVTWVIEPLDIIDAEIVVEEPTFSGLTEALVINSVKTNGLDVTYEVLDESTNATWAADVTTGAVLTNTLKITGTGNFKGTATKQWNVKPLNISTSNAKLVMKYSNNAPAVYSGEEFTNETTSVKVTHPTRGELTFTDATLGWEYGRDVSAIKVGSYALRTQGVKNFTGYKDLGWKIAQRNADGFVTVTVDDASYDHVYKREEKKPTLTLSVAAPAELTADDYSAEYSYEDNINAGTASVTVYFKGNYSGSVTKTFEIEKATINAVTLDATRLEWTGAEQSVAVASVTTANDVILEATEYTAEGLTGTKAGEYKAMATAANDNFTGSAEATWEIAPTAPIITPNGASFKTGYMTVKITSSQPTEGWTIQYEVYNSDKELIKYGEYTNTSPDGQKFDIEGRATVRTRAVSTDGKVYSQVTVAEFYNGENIAPMAALVPETGRPADLPNCGDAKTVDAAEGKLLQELDATVAATNFWHSNMKVCLTRFGFKSAAEAEIAKTQTTTLSGNCPWTDGNIWYTLAEGDAELVEPTTNGTPSVKFDLNDQSTWPTISTNTTIIAKVFGKELMDSASVTNTFIRNWAKMSTPTITSDATFNHQWTINLTKVSYTGKDWDASDENVEIWWTKDNWATTNKYLSAFMVTSADVNENNEVIVKAFAQHKDATDHLASDEVVGTYTWEQIQFKAPAISLEKKEGADDDRDADEFAHKGAKVVITWDVASEEYSEVDGVIKYMLNDGTVQTYTDKQQITTNTVVKAWVEPSNMGTYKDYAGSVTNETTYHYAPYKMVAPIVTTGTDFTAESMVVTISRPAADTTMIDNKHRRSGNIYYTTDGTTPTAESLSISNGSKEITITATTTVKAIMLADDDHLDSEVVTQVFTRYLPGPKATLTESTASMASYTKGNGEEQVFKHKGVVKFSCASDANYSYKLNGVLGGTYDPSTGIEITDTSVIEVTATATGAVSSNATITFTREWETLKTPDLKLEIYATSTDKGKIYNHSHETIKVVEDVMDTDATHVLWDNAAYEMNTNVTIMIGTNEQTIATTYEQGKNFLQADVVDVWAVVSVEDYLPATNHYEFVREIATMPTPPTIEFRKQFDPRGVSVTFKPHTGNVVYYTVVTNGVPEDPVGIEYGFITNATKVTKTGSKFTTTIPMDVGATITIKAIAYTEDEDTAEGMQGVCFTAKSGVSTKSYTLEWTVGDTLEAPKRKFTIKGDSAKCLEFAGDYSTIGDYGDYESHSSMVFTNLVDSETVAIETTVAGTGIVSFDWKTLCEKGPHDFNRDHITFYIDGVAKAKLDGVTGWTNVAIRIQGDKTDSHTLRWAYEKDASEAYVDDCAFLDHFKWNAEEIQLALDTPGLADWISGIDEEIDTSDMAQVSSFLDRDAAAMKSAHSTKAYKYWECFVVGLAVDDPDAKFEISAVVIDDYSKSASMTFKPMTAGRTYQLLGKKSLTDSTWTTCATLYATETKAEGGTIAEHQGAGAEGYQFFHVTVELTK